MWNKFVEILQQPASIRLVLAIVISALLHLVLVGNMSFSLPPLKNDMHLIEARIQMPKVEPQKPVPQPKVIAEPKPVIQALPEAHADKSPEVVAPESKLETTASDTIEVAPKPEQIVSPQDDIEPSPPEDPIEAEDIGLVINENAYQYIETQFDVRTEIDGSAKGRATITYNVIENMQYRIKWHTEGTGIRALLFPELLQTSAGELTKSGLRPQYYLYQFGEKADKTRSASFDWQSKKVTLQTAKGTKTEDLPDDTQDLLSFMYQFMHVAPLQHMQIPIVNGKKLHIYDYSFEGEEQVNSALGELKTLHIMHSGNNEDERTELWLAMDYQYAPVKIRKIESDGSVVEMLATHITTNRPVINQETSNQ